MRKVFILAGVVVLLYLMGATNYAPDAPAVVDMRMGYMVGDHDFGLDLPCTLAVNDTVFVRWLTDKNGDVNPYMFSVNVDVNQFKTTTYAAKLYMYWANDTNDVFLVDSCKSGGSVATFDSTYQEVPVGARFYRWYFISSDSCVLYDFGVFINGYGR